MIQWLSNPKTPRPKRLDGPPTGDAAGAHVLPAFDAGSIVLQRGDRVFNLVWSAKDKDRRRALPAGEYRLRSTHLAREADDAWWFISQSGPPFEKVPVAKTGATKFTLIGTVRFDAAASRDDKKLMLTFSITGADDRNVSVFRNGKRITVAYKVFDAKGKELAHGPMKYG